MLFSGSSFSYMAETDLSKLASGKTSICKDKVFANVMETEAVGPEDIAYKIHRSGNL